MKKPEWRIRLDPHYKWWIIERYDGWFLGWRRATNKTFTESELDKAKEHVKDLQNPTVHYL